jgi:predicted transcriptional regulator
MSAGDPLLRPDVYVLVRLFDGLRQDSNRVRRTQLQQRAGVNYTLFSRYLAFLIQKGFLRVVMEGDGEYLEITPRGEEAYRFLAEGLARILGDGSIR